ncbi:MAG: tRNA (adenosine(37)-N6)-dimethylallyltransferase MiaA [Pseudobutyrivibrio sp.]|nr:tRNA (adenosine(37)-N6)-dimethylallyltransferase MiaA [Pseudobutyrivibrio sp.]
MKKPLIVLTGPTAVGKTSLSIELAKRINGEIISADCMQVYKYMDIGTAKITPQEMDGINHYLIDAIYPNEEFHVVKFKEMATRAIDEIYGRGHIPIICGGTGFYIQALLYDIEFTDNASNDRLRQELSDYADKYGNEALLGKLKEVDKVSASEIPANNRKRIIRAIEYYTLTGQTISEHNRIQRHREAVYNYAYFVINDNRDILYNRINSRVDLMIKAGLEAEVKNLIKMGYSKDLQSMSGIGYKEMIEYIEGNISKDDAIDSIKQNSRHYAKRQLTWFRREKDIIWLEKEELKNQHEMLNKIKEELLKRGIISEGFVQ